MDSREPDSREPDSSEPDSRTLDAPFGVEVRRLSWGPPSPELVDRLTALLRRHLLILFRGHEAPTLAQLEEFFGGFGTRVSQTSEGRLQYQALKDASATSQQPVNRSAEGVLLTNEVGGGASELIWHHDHEYRPQLKVISALEAIDCAPGSTPTWFRDMYTAYETLPPGLRSTLEHKQVVHHDPARRGSAVESGFADAMHPVFTAHPHSTRRSLFVGERTDRIAGTSDEASRQLLDQIQAHARRFAPTYVHHWQNGDLCMWDNIGLQHRRDALPEATGPADRRVLRVFEGIAE